MHAWHAVPRCNSVSIVPPFKSRTSRGLWCLRSVGMQELNSRQVLRLWSAAAHLRRMRGDNVAALRDKAAAAALHGAWKDWRAWRCGCRVVRRMYVVSPFACWRQRASDRALAKARLLRAVQVCLSAPAMQRSP